MKKHFFILICVSIAFWIFSGPQILADPSTQPPEMETVRIQFKWFHQFQFAGYYAAKEKGFYADAGLDVVFQERNRETDPIDDVLEGRAEYGTADAGLLFYRLRGKPVVILAQIFQHSPLVLLTLKSSGYQTPYDLAGKKIMIDSRSFSDAPVNGMLSNTIGGFDEFQPVPMNFRYSDLTKGKVDAVVAYITDQPYTFKKNGVEINILDPRDYGIDFYGDNLFTTEREIKEHPERVKKMIQATLKGWEYALDHKDEIIALIREKYNRQKFTKDHLVYEAEQTELMIMPQFYRLGHFEASRLQKIAEIYVTLGLTDQLNINKGFFCNHHISDIRFSRHEKNRLRETPAEIGPDLTLEEKVWLGNLDAPLRVANEMDWPPFDYNERGEPKGFSIDYVKLLAGKTGFEIEFVDEYTWPELIRLFKQKKIDIMPAFYRNSDRETFTLFTDSYYRGKLAIFSRSLDDSIQTPDDLQGKKLGIQTGDGAVETIKRMYPEAGFVEIDSNDMLVQSLAMHKVDAIIGNPLVLYHHARENQIADIRLMDFIPMSGEQQMNVSLHIGVRKDLPILHALLVKAMKSVSDREMKTIENKWMLETPAAVRKKIDFTREEKAWLENRDAPLRVGNEMDWPPFDFAENGEPRGFSIDLFKLVAARIGIELEFINGFTWKELMEKFKKGEFDVLPAVTDIPERHAFMLFTSPYIINSSVIVTHNKNQDLKSIHDLEGKKLAVIEGWTATTIVGKHYPAIQQIKVGSVLEALESVSLEKADAYLGNLGPVSHALKNRFVPDIRVVSAPGMKHFGERKLCFGVAREKTILRSILQKGLDSVSPAEIRVLRQKWLSLTVDTPGDDAASIFSEAEKNWLSKHPDIRLGIDPSWSPFEFTDPDGKYSGIASGMIDALEGRLGIRMTPVPDLTWSQVIEGVKKGEIDVLPAVAPSNQRREYLNFTKPYVSLPVVIAAHRKMPFIGSFKELEGYRVGVIKGYYTEDRMREDHPRLLLVTFETITESLRQLESGRIDAFVGNLVTVNDHINRLSLNNIRISSVTGYKMDICLGVRKDLPELVGILSKALDNISSQEIAAIKNTWMTSQDIKIGVDARKILIWAIPIGTSALLIILFVAIWNRRLGREVNDRIKAQKAVTRRAQWAEGLQKAGRELSTCKSIDSLADVACHAVVKYLDVTNAWVGVPDTNGEIRMLAVRGVNDREWIQKNGETCQAKVIADGQTIIVPDALNDPPFPECAEFARKCGFGCCAVFPVFSEKKTVAALSIRTLETGGNSSLVQISPLIDTLVQQVGYIWQRCLSETAMRKMMDDLENARKDAEKATRAKSDFLATMSHEIRTPMNSVIGFLSLALDDPDVSEKLRGYLNTAHGSSRALLSLINDILDVSKLESGKLELEKIPFDLHSMMRETIRGIVIRAGEKGLSLELDIRAEVPRFVAGDPARLKQILINLIGNAVKFTEKGGVTVRASSSDRKDFLHFSVTDTGVGIPAGRIDKIFESFTQADSSTSRRFGGTGLGTTISRQLTELMGGRIWAESITGKGSTFHFTARLEQTDAVPEDRPERSATEFSRCFKILVAEDIKENIMLAKIRLQDQGHSVIQAQNGVEAVCLFEREDPDIILMDVHMPEMDGLEATARIRGLEDASNTRIPIVALTASLMKEEQNMCISAGMDAVTGKPVDFDELFELMEKLVPVREGELIRPSESDETPGISSDVIPETLEGIDTRKGLQIWQNEAVYIKALLGFARDYGNAADKMRKLEQAGDGDGVRKIAHAIKGVAGNLAIPEVFRIAAALNNRNDEESQEERLVLIGSLEQALSVAVNAIHQLKPAAEIEETPPRKIAPHEIEPLFNQLMNAFETYNPAEILPFISRLSGIAAEEHLRPIREGLEAFDFDSAREKTVRLSQILGLKTDAHSGGQAQN